MKIDEPDAVDAEYACERAFAVRSGAYRWSVGPNPRDLALSALAEAEPRRVLDVGCGTGDLTEQLLERTGAEVVGVDPSPRMLELARRREIPAVAGRAEALPFADSEFDAVLAAWVLYHCGDVDLAVTEIARVTGEGGRLVAVTSGADHWRELYEALEVAREPWPFSGENGAEILGHHFERVRVIEARGWLEFPDAGALHEFVEATISLRHAVDRLKPDGSLLRVSRSTLVFVADEPRRRAELRT